MRKPIVISNDELYKKVCDMGFKDQILSSVPDKFEPDKMVHFFKYVDELWLIVKEFKETHGRA